MDNGIYSLVVIDSLACIDTFNIHLNSPQNLDVDIITNNSNLSFFGQTTNVFVDISGGVPPYLISWNDLDTNQQRIIGAGFYSVLTTDANGCFTIDSILIDQPEQLVVDIELIVGMSCNNGAMVSAIVNGGTPPYTYSWTGPSNFSADTSTIDSLTSGVYTVVVRDSSNIFVIDTISINEYEINANITYDTLSHLALVEIVNTNFSGPFTYEWIDTLYNHTNLRFPSFDSVSPFLCGGNIYFVKITDESNNCTVIKSVEVPKDNIYDEILDIASTQIDTSNLINLWGTPPYNYLWDDSLWSTTFNGYPCPSYDSSMVEITDYNDCKLRYKFFIDQIIITLDPASAILECNIENLDINLEAQASGGTGDFSYTWWNGTSINPINLGLSPGKFSLTVSDANNCKQDTSFVIAVLTNECVPNVFSPNGDGINDYWSLEDTFLYEDSEIIIYGRFGKLIFQSFGYNEKWDGTNKAGNDVPDGVYFYSIIIGHGYETINGTVTILR